MPGTYEVGITACRLADLYLGRMENNNRGTRSAAEAKTAQPGTIPSDNAEAGAAPPPRLKELLLELVALAKSGEDPGRWKKLCAELDAERLRGINQALAAGTRQYQVLERDRDAMEARMLSTFAAALGRRDLTWPDFILIHQLISQMAARRVNAALTEKARLERKADSDKPRRRRSYNAWSRPD